MSDRLIIIPRWEGTPDCDWYPWLVRTLQSDGARRFASILVGEMPQPAAPTIPAWVARIGELVGDLDEARLQRTLIVGHSVGCRAALYWLASLPQEKRIKGVLSVAGWWTVRNAWDTLKPWIETPLDLRRARDAAGRFVTLISDDDPFTPDWRSNRQAWIERLGAQVQVVSGRQHFNAAAEPSVELALSEMLSG